MSFGGIFRSDAGQWRRPDACFPLLGAVFLVLVPLAAVASDQNSGPLAEAPDVVPPIFGPLGNTLPLREDGAPSDPASVSGDAAATEDQDALPAYDPLRYCSMLSGLVQDSGEARRKCLLKEEEARIRLEGLSLPADLVSECDSVARSMGGSYLVLLGCVEDTSTPSPD